MLYQDLVVLSGEGNYATLHRPLLMALFDADVNHLWEVTECLHILETQIEQNVTVAGKFKQLLQLHLLVRTNHDRRIDW